MGSNVPAQNASFPNLSSAISTFMILAVMNAILAITARITDSLDKFSYLQFNI